MSAIVWGLLFASQARALPAGGQVSAGAAAIQQPTLGQTAPTLTVNQSSQNAAINWQSFGIGANEAVRFNQPNANSVTLNRVTGQDPSQILGKLTANGQIFLLNPNGILFGQGAQVNAGGIVASTLGMSDADFMAGNYSLANGGSAGVVVNEGEITVTAGGYVALIGTQVTNVGKIKAPDGSVALAAGDRVTLTFADGGLAGLNVDIGTLNALVANKGAIIAGKQVILTAKAIDQLTKSVVNNTGIIEAAGINEHNGVITLAGDNVTNAGKIIANKTYITASNNAILTDVSKISAQGTGSSVAITGGVTGAANIGGTIDAAAKRANQAGGQVFITAGMVAIDSSTLIDVSGPAGGGTINIGGGLHGGGALAHAMAVTIASRATMNADATGNGDGGVIAIWSDGTSQVSGALSAKGGALGGNGGIIETSGHVLDTTGISIDASAPLGASGTWLLDPTNLTVTTSATTGTTASPNFTSNVTTTSNVLNTAINTALISSNVVLTTTGGNVTISAPISKTGATATTLTVNASGNITIGSSSAISASGGALNVTLDADNSGSGAGSGGGVSIGSSISTNGGNIIIGGQNAPLTAAAVGTSAIGVNVAAALGAGGGNITINGTGYNSSNSSAYGINVTAALSTTGNGTITLKGTGAGSGYNEWGVYASANITTATGAISITGTSGASATQSGNHGVVLLGATTSTSSNGTITITGTAQGSATTGASRGVLVTSGAVVTSGGLISVTGTNSSTDNGGTEYGVYVTGTGSTIKSTGTGGVTVIGTGGGSGSGGTNYGVFWDVANGIQSTSTGAISITGTGGDSGGSGTGNNGVNTTYAISGNGGAISINGSVVNSSGGYGINVSSIATGTATITLTSTAALNATAALTGGSLNLLGTGGVFSLTNASNAVTTLAGNTGSVTYSQTGAMTIGTVGSTAGLTTTGNTVLSSIGAVTQSQPIVAAGLDLLGTGGAYTLTNTGNAITTLAGSTGSVSFVENSGFAIGTVGSTSGLTTTGNTVLSSTGAVTQSSLIAAAGLNLLGAGGAYTLTNTSNAVTTLAGSTGAVTYSQTGALSIGTVGTSAGLATSSATALSVTTGGNLTIASGATVSGASPTLAATGAFINNGGSGAVTVTSGRWLIYSANSTGDTFGSLNSNNAAVWNTASGASVTPTGNRYVFANQPTLTVTTNNLSKVYGVDNTATVTADYTITGLQSVTNAYSDTASAVYSGTPTVTSSGSAATATVAGSTYTINATVGSLSSLDGYALAYANTGVLTITQAALTVTASNQSRVYGPTSYVLGSQTTGFTTSGLVNSDSVSSVTLTGTAAATNAATGVGTLTGAITASAASGTGLANYTISYVAGNAAITQAALTVTASNQSRVYGPTSYAFGSQTTQFTTSGLVNSDSVSSVTLTGTAASTAATTGVGTLTGAITASGASGSGLSNYAITYAAGNATITQAALTVTASNQSRVYGPTSYALGSQTTQFTTSGLVNSDSVSSVTLTGTASATNAATGVGTLTGAIAASAAVGAGLGNYTISYVAGNATIAQAALTVTASNQSRVYGPTSYALGSQTTGFTTGGLVNSDSVSSVTLTGTAASTAATTGIGTLTGAITASGATGTGLSNYTISYVAGNAAITQAALTVTANAQSRGYGAANPALTYSTNGLVNGDTLSGSLTTSATATSNVGPYAINQGSLAASSNYALTYNGANLTITQAALTVTASNQTRVYGPTSYALGSQTTGFTVNGLVNSDSVASVTLTGTASATNAATGVGTLSGAITASGASGAGLGNYTISYVAGNATITQAALTVTADAQSRVYGAANPALTYTQTGLVNGDTLSGSLATSATTASGVGTYGITQGGLTASSNYALTYNGANLTVTQAALTVTASNQSRVYGAVNPALTYSANGLVNGDALTGSLTTTATTASGVGTYGITQGGLTASSNYALTYNGANLTVTAAPLTVTASNQSRVYGPTSYALGSQTTGFTTSGIVNSDSVSSVTLTGTAAATNAATGVGTLTGAITASGAAGTGLGNYTISYVAGNATITAAPLTITAGSLSKTYGATVSFAGTEFTASGLQNNETVGSASLSSAGAVATAGVGSSPYGIGVSSATGGTFNPANYNISYVGATLTVNPAPLTVTASTQSRAYGAANPTLTYTATGLVNNDTLSGALTTTAMATSSVAGSPYAITQGTLTSANNPNYAITYNGANLTVTPAALTVTADAQSRAYGSANPVLTYTTTGLVNNDTLTGSLTTSATTASPVGTYAITQGTLTSANNPNYAITYNGANLTVTPAALTVTADAQSRAYGSANPALTYTATGLVNGDTLSGTLTTTAATASPVGAYPITIGSVNNPNYTVNYTGANLTVTAAPLTITASNQSRVYGPTSYAVGSQTTQFTTSGLVNSDSVSSVTLTGTAAATNAATGVGTLTGAITASAASGTGLGNYTISYVAGNAAITQAVLTVTADAQSRAYGSVNPTLTYTALGLVNSDTLTGSLTTTATTASGVGSYAITQGSLVASANYALTYNSANLTVTQAALTVTADAQSRGYGSANPALTYSTTGLVNNDTLTGSLTTSATTASGVGSYAITQGSLAASGNYAVSYNGANLMVTQAALTVTASNQSRVYGAVNPALTYSANGLVNGDALTGSLTTTATTASGVGTYGITQGGLTASSNYALTYNGANLTVTQAALTVTADTQSRVYGSSNPALTYTTTGLVNNDTLTGSLTTSATTASPVGTYAITQGTLTSANNPNYAVTYIGANLTVNTATATVTANAQSRAYGAANPTLTYTATGLVNGDTLSGTLTTTATTTSPIGAYSITIGSVNNPNYAISYTGANLIVTAAPLTITANAQTRAYGVANPSLTYTQTGLVNGDTLSGALATSATTASGVGTYGITQGTLTASSNYAISYTGANMTVSQAALTITADAQSRTYGAANPSLTYTAIGLVNNDILSGSLATSATMASPVANSPYTITQGTLTSANNPNYAITYVGANLTVTPASLTVTASNQSRVYGPATYALGSQTTGFTTSGLVNSDSVSSVTLTGTAAATAAATGVGTLTGAITASGAAGSGLSNYTITYVAGNAAITQAALTVTAGAQSRAYGVANPALTYTATGLVNGDTLTGALTTTATTVSSVGTYAITQGGLTASSNYAVTYNGANLTVTQAALTVTASAQSRVYGAANPALTYTQTGLVNGDTLTGALTTTATTASPIGPYAITQGSLAASANYALTYNGANLTVTQAALTVTANAQSRTYGAANPTLTYTTTGLVNGDTLGGALTTTATTTSSVGSYGIVQGSLAASSNYALTYNGANLTVTQAALTVTANAQSRAYGAANPTLTYTTTGLVNGDTLGGALTTTATTASGIGTYGITQGGLTASSNYALTYNGANLTVTQAALRVTANAQSRAYGAANPTLTYTTTGLVNGDTLGGALTTTATTASGIGTYGITQGGLTASSNYALTYNGANLTVTQAALTVTANAQSRAYGAANPTLTYTTTGLVNGDTLGGALTTTATTASGVGTYGITQGGLTASSNYAVTYNGANLTVTQAALTVTANAQSRAYGAANPTLTYTTTGLVNGDTLTGALTTTATATSSVANSPYAITQGGLTASSNYALTYNGANLTITQAALTVTADAQSRTYGAANPSLTYTATGLVNGDTLTGVLTTTATATSSVAGLPYAITQGTLTSANNPNYAITYVGANLTVTQAALTVTANAQSRTYGAANPTLTYTTTGLVNGDTLGGALTTTATTVSSVGSYAIAQGTLAASSNYALTYNGANLTITQAALTVTADAQSRAYGAANPTLTYTTAGLVNGDTLTGALTTTATTVSSVGSYAIAQGTLAASSNYALTYNGANLTITQAALTVTADAQSRAYGAANPTLTYTTAGLVNGDTLTGELTTTATAISNVGTYGITQGTLGNANYTVSYTGANLTVTQAALTVTADAQSRAYGSANPVLTYTTTGLVNGDTLSGALTTSATTSSPVGTYAITQGTLTGANNPNYAISYIGANLTVNTATATVFVTANAQSRAYGAANPTLTYTATGLVNGDTLTGNLTTTATTASPVGAYPITIGSVNNPNYTINYTGANLTVTAAPLTITANAASRAYGVANLALTYSASGLVNGDMLSGSLATSATATSNVGSYAITQGTLGNTNYAITYNGANLTVTQAALTVTANAQSRAYGAANPVLTYTQTGLVNGDTLTGSLTTSASRSSSVGSYGITQGSLAASANYAVTYNGANLTITQAALTVTADAQSWAYGAVNPILTYSTNGLVNSDILSGSLTTSAGTSSNVGSYAITQGTLATSSNYMLTYNGANLTITQAPLTVTANNQSRVYGPASYALGSQTTGFTTSGLVNSDSVSSVTLTGTAAATSAPTGVGTLTGAITASGASGTGLSNYLISYVAGNASIIQAALTVTANAQSRTYGAANPALTYTQTGLVNGDTLSGILTTTATPSSSVGSYAITQGTLTASSNYAVTYNSANLTVTAAPLTITADAQSRAYGAANPALTYTQTGLVAGDSLTGSLTTSATTESSTGTYPIMIGSLNNPNYTITYNGADLAITAAPQTVAASAAMAAAVATVVTVSTNVAVSRYAVTQGDQLGSSSYSSGIVNTALTIQPVGQITLINNGINIPGDLTPSASVGTINTQIKKSLATTNDSASITAGTQ